MSVNVEMLKQKMKEKDMSVDGLAKRLGVNPSTVYRKFLSDGEAFTVGEMHKIMEELCLSEADVKEIFLFQNL